jgi:transcriptional regulator with XRE-family HTH domain
MSGAEALTEARKAEAAYQAAFRRAEDKRIARNYLVRRAIQAGCTHAEIAAATGLTRSRVGQIALGENAKDE